MNENYESHRLKCLIKKSESFFRAENISFINSTSIISTSHQIKPLELFDEHFVAVFIADKYSKVSKYLLVRGNIIARTIIRVH